MSEFPAHWYAQVTSFDPPRGIEAPPDWDAAVRLLAEHGVAAIAAYNLQYRMPDARVPELSKDVLMGYYQGIVNDNVFKLVTLKQALSGLDARVLVLDAAAYADTLYPHVAFRPVPELRLWIREADLEAVARGLGEHEFHPVEPGEKDPDGPRFTLYNRRFHLKLFTSFLPYGAEEAGVFDRAVQARAFGAAAHRLAAEDALLVHVLSQARHGFAVPLVSWVDLRELVAGTSAASSRGGPGAPLDPAVVKARAAAFGVEKPLWAALELLVHFHPSLEAKARALQPDLSRAARAAIETMVVAPAKDPTRERQVRGLGALVQLLLGS